MTFEEWLENQPIVSCCDYHGSDVIRFVKEAWFAAKSEVKEQVTVEYSSLVEDWTVRDSRGACIEDGFTSQNAATAWAEFKGYEVV